MKAVPDRVKVEPVIDETGRRRYPGSIAQQHFDLSPTQKSEVLRQLKTRPLFATDIQISDRSPYDPSSAESIRRYLGELIEDRRVELIKDAKGKSLGWKSTEKPSAIEIIKQSSMTEEEKAEAIAKLQG
jgi:hypothetical protein